MSEYLCSYLLLFHAFLACDNVVFWASVSLALCTSHPGFFVWRPWAHLTSVPLLWANIMLLSRVSRVCIIIYVRVHTKHWANGVSQFPGQAFHLEPRHSPHPCELVHQLPPKLLPSKLLSPWKFDLVHDVGVCECHVDDVEEKAERPSSGASDAGSVSI